jgi:peptidyl-prolyl cis-trans isomerase D
MFRTLQSQQRAVKIILGAVLGLVSLGMLLYLVPAPVSSLGNSSEGIADVAGERISAADLQRRYDLLSSQQAIPSALRPLYIRQILDQMVFDRLLEVEGNRLGVGVTDKEVADRIRMILPEAFPGGRWIGADQYAALVQQRLGISVDEFEQRLRTSLLEEKFRELVTAGIGASPEEVMQEFMRRNEKVKITYALITPQAIAAGMKPGDKDLEAYYEQNKSRYQVPERRSVGYLLLDLNRLRQHLVISDAELRADYKQHLGLYEVPERVHLEHILFKTIGKTDAEVAEIRVKAEKVLAEARHGANFEGLAKKYSEDPASASKGGDIGWIVHGQTAPALEQPAFRLPKNAISDLIQTPYGFDIVKVLDHENAHTKSFEEVRSSILDRLLSGKLDQTANQIADQMASVVRQSNRKTFEDVLAGLDALGRASAVSGETPPASVEQPVGDLGNAPQIRDAVFSQRPGELSLPIRVDRGYAIVSVKQILPAHQGAFDEVRARVEADYVKEKSTELARAKAEELARRAASGEGLEKAAKALGIEVKTSDPFTRAGSVPAVGGGEQLAQAFAMKVGETSPATQVGAKWIVFMVTGREVPGPDDFAKQASEVSQEVVSDKQEAAFEAFRIALEDQMQKAGKLRINSDNLKRVTGS